MPGTHGASEQVQRLREAFLEFAEAPAALEGDNPGGDHQPCHSKRNRQELMQEQVQPDQISNQAQHPARQHQNPRFQVHSGLRNKFAKAYRPIPLHHQTVQWRHCAEQFAAKQFQLERTLVSGASLFDRLQAATYHLLMSASRGEHNGYQQNADNNDECGESQ